MAKKYVPSGYQIINVGEMDLGSPITVSINDKPEYKILYDLIHSHELKKPILFNLYETNEGLFAGFISSIGGFLIFNSKDYELKISSPNNDELKFELTIN